MDKEYVQEVADSMYGETSDPKTGFTMNVIHHHHEHVVVSGNESQNNGQGFFDMIMQMHLMKSLVDGFTTNPLLTSPDAPTKFISAPEEKVEYQVIESESESSKKGEDLFRIHQPIFNPIYKGRKYYEVISSSFFPGWKITIRELNINTPLAIIILTNYNEHDERQSDYIALYNSSPIFSKAMYGKNSPKEQDIPRDWSHAPWFVETLKELESVSQKRNQKFAYYIEEIELEGKNRFDSILSNDFPKTEVIEFRSIFGFKPDIVYTNFERNIFRVEFNELSFKIRRM